ncbi:MAG TPA: transcriptional regulator NrdR [Limnobacter sp.]|uniref:transcriptional regulator NrdR n=1 Tax=Limnobacter sp. TaxID=2003368 RepID=UPI002EDA5D6F
MKCPFCNHVDTQVVDSRTSDDGDAIRRRRQCGSCSKRFTTYERAELFFPAIVKKDGSRVEFSREKLRGSLMLALRKRPVPAEAIDNAVASIEEKLLINATREVDTKFLGELVMQQLKQLDPVAYIRFASVYKSFDDLQRFSEEIAKLLIKPAEQAELKPTSKPRAVKKAS